MKLLYKPFALIAGIIGARLGRAVFKQLWAQVDDGDPPSLKTPDASLGKVVGAQALEAATLAGVGAAVDRASRRSFQYLVGIWPGDKPTDEQQERSQLPARTR
jgi:Protein of unknown function (DUF4235)